MQRAVRSMGEERFLGSFGDYDGTAGVDLSEEDIWLACGAEDAGRSGGEAAELYGGRGGGQGQIGRRQVSGLSSALVEEEGEEREGTKRVVHRLRNVDARAASKGRRRCAGPVRIMRVESAGSLHLFRQGDSDGEDEGGGWVPPHEYLARSARSMNAHSVVEGAGRTLKGRDMSRVRDAVWSQTGFFG